MKKFILLFIIVLVSMVFSDNIIQRGVNKQLEYITATGKGSDTLPFTPSVLISSPIDSVLRSVIVITPGHHEAHEGNRFYVKGFKTLSNQDSLLILFAVKSIPAHALFIVSPQDGEGIVKLYEDVTVSDSGDTCISFNRRRSSLNIATVRCFTDPTITDYGTLLYPAKVGSGKSFGGEVRETNEIIGDTNTLYLMVLDNNTTSANTLDYLMDWYEHVDD